MTTETRQLAVTMGNRDATASNPPASLAGEFGAAYRQAYDATAASNRKPPVNPRPSLRQTVRAFFGSNGAAANRLR